MKTTDSIPGYSRLSVPEKILKLEELWDEIAEKGAENAPVPLSHRAELNRRHARYIKRPGSILSLKELQDSIGYK